MLFRRKTDETYHSYVIIRNDLPDAQKTVQACHAVWEIAARYNSTSLVCLIVRDEKKLLKTMKMLEENGVEYSAFQEPMEPYNNSYTALCTQPLKGEKRKLLSKYQLL